jgi:hypothetical protein
VRTVVVVILSLPLFRLPCARSARGPGGFTRPLFPLPDYEQASFHRDIADVALGSAISATWQPILSSRSSFLAFSSS